MAISILRRGLVQGRVNRLHGQACIAAYLLLSYTGQQGGVVIHHVFQQPYVVHQARMLPNQHPQGKCSLVDAIPTNLTQASHSHAWELCFLACSGISFAATSTGIPFSSLGLKLKRGGRKRPFGRRVPGSRSSSKKG